MSGKAFWNPVRNPYMSSFSGTFDLWIDFNDLHFTDSPNASPLDSMEFLGLKENEKLHNPQRFLRLFPFSSS
jgi:hypothetical protein